MAQSSKLQTYDYFVKFKSMDRGQIGNRKVKSDSNCVLNIQSRVGATNGSALVLVAL